MPCLSAVVVFLATAQLTWEGRSIDSRLLKEEKEKKYCSGGDHDGEEEKKFCEGTCSVLTKPAKARRLSDKPKDPCDDGGSKPIKTCCNEDDGDDMTCCDNWDDAYSKPGSGDSGQYGGGEGSYGDSGDDESEFQYDELMSSCLGGCQAACQQHCGAPKEESAAGRRLGKGKSCKDLNDDCELLCDSNAKCQTATCSQDCQETCGGPTCADPQSRELAKKEKTKKKADPVEVAPAPAPVVPAAGAAGGGPCTDFAGCITTCETFCTTEAPIFMGGPDAAERRSRARALAHAQVDTEATQLLAESNRVLKSTLALLEQADQTGPNPSPPNYI